MSKSNADLFAQLLVTGVCAYAGAAQAQHDANVNRAAARIESQRRRRSLEVLGQEFGLLLRTMKRSWSWEAKDLVKEVIVKKDRGVTANQLHQMLDALNADYSREELCDLLENRVTNPGKLDLEAHFTSRYTARRAEKNFI